MRVTLVCLLMATLTACATPRPAGTAPPAPPPDLVVLVHGMGRTHLSMWAVERRLRRAGYRVLNVGYSSYGPDVPAIGRQVAEAVARERARTPTGRVHFVTHSLGGVVVRWVLAHERPDGTGRVVQLAPPNQGAASADRLAPYVGWLLRPIRELRTDTSSTVRRLPPSAGVPVLVIAGTRDGKVSADEAFLEGAERADVEAGHTFLMWEPSVLGLIEAFLDGDGAPDATPEASADPAQATVTSSLR